MVAVPIPNSSENLVKIKIEGFWFWVRPASCGIFVWGVVFLNRILEFLVKVFGINRRGSVKIPGIWHGKTIIFDPIHQQPLAQKVSH